MLLIEDDLAGDFMTSWGHELVAEVEAYLAKVAAFNAWLQAHGRA